MVVDFMENEVLWCPFIDVRTFEPKLRPTNFVRCEGNMVVVQPPRGAPAKFRIDQVHKREQPGLVDKWL